MKEKPFHYTAYDLKKGNPQGYKFFLGGRMCGLKHHYKQMKRNKEDKK